MLEISALSKSYPNRGVVLNDLFLTIREGDTVAITGPSGSGKTTLLNLAGLLDRPDSGQILFNGRAVERFSDDEAASYRNESVGFVFQDHLLMPYLTVHENVLLPVLARKKRPDKSDLHYSDELIKEVGLYELKDKLPGQISGGEAQRCALIRALINRPLLILADEPTGSLDSQNAETIASLLCSINERHGTALLVVTHSGALADKMKKKYRLEGGSLS